VSATADTVRRGPGSQDASLRVWSTLSVAADEAAAYWREVVRQLCVGLGIEPAPGTAFCGEISRRAYGDFSLAVSRASGGMWRRTRGDIARGRDEDEYLCATVLTQGRGVLEQAGRQAELVPGSLVFYDTSEPFALRFDEPWEQVVVHVPVEQALASAGVKRSADLLAVRLDGDGAAGAAAAFLRSLAFAQRDDPNGADLLAQYVPGLLASSLNVLAARQSALRRAGSGPSDLIGRERVLGFLRAHLAGPDLDADAIARGCYLSKRTLYRLFEGTEGSVMGRLRQLRVERAQLLLRRCPDRPASAIGRECGFPSDTQFHRVFRELTGMTPVGYRDAAAAALPG
jgi:AraC family transcriptional regulator, positive regulator of tynA and feaB